MPSPLGHGLAALAVGWAVVTPPAERSRRLTQAGILVAVGVAPDLDFLIGRHSMETHSIGAAVVVASVAAWRRWPVASSRAAIWAVIFLAWMSHPLLDALNFDWSDIPPRGPMAFWPFYGEHLHTDIGLFGPISRRYWLDSFWRINLGSIAREIFILGPIAATAWLVRRRGLTTTRYE
jgi:hypothetical protein